MSDWTFFRRLMIVVAVFVLGVLVWQLSVALLLLFAAVLFALMLDGATDLVERYTPLGRPYALTLVIVLILGGVWRRSSINMARSSAGRSTISPSACPVQSTMSSSGFNSATFRAR